MRFDWRVFCNAHKVPYVVTGPNTARGHISIKCPWCGNADPSEHMGLSLDPARPAWGCFRNSRHRGLHPAWLIAKLLHIPPTAARELVEKTLIPVDDFAASIDRLKNKPIKANGHAHPHFSPQPQQRCLPPPEFRPLAGDTSPYAHRFFDYMAIRGFPNVAHVARFSQAWYAITGPYAWHVIFPIHSLDGFHRMIGWIGRDIRYTSKRRYLAMDLLPPEALLYFGDTTFSIAKTVILCEGAFDALKLDVCGRPYGIRAIATLGTALVPERLAVLNKVCKQVSKTVVVFDTDAYGNAMTLSSQLAEFGVNVVAKPVPNGVKDPGEMPVEVARRFCNSLLS